MPKYCGRTGNDSNGCTLRCGEGSIGGGVYQCDACAASESKSLSEQLRAAKSELMQLRAFRHRTKFCLNVLVKNGLIQEADKKMVNGLLNHEVSK